MSSSESGEVKKGISKMLLAGIILSFLSFLTFYASGFGYDWQIWGLGAAIDLFQWGAAGSLAGLLLTLIGAGKANFSLPVATAGMSWVSLILSLAVVGTAIYFIVLARSVPPIHDITTNFEDPPRFEVLREKREKAPNEVEYPGGKTTELQREHYPDVESLWIDLSPEEVFKAAIETAQHKSNWKIQAADSAEGRIEATHTILWFGFKDDVVIRIRPDSARGQVRVDMRSASRIGKSDLGVNARRVKNYMQSLSAKLKSISENR